MINKNNWYYKAMLLVAGGLLVCSCDSDPDSLGSQFFDGDTADGIKAAYDVVAYNLTNNDTIRSDGRISSSVRKDTLVLGAFSEPQFGKQKASFVSQIRMGSYAPSFGVNPVIDSVVMVLKPSYYSASDSVTTTTNEDYIWPEGSVAAKKVVKTYPVYKYGKKIINGAPAKLTVNINEVNNFLGSVSDTILSNAPVSVGTLIGSKTINGYITTVEITKDSDNSELLSRTTPSIRIPLDNNFFKTKILDKEGQADLSNVANFIRYFKGIRISVAEDDGYMMKLAIPSSEDIVMYYKRNTSATDTTRVQASLSFNLSSSNPSFSQIEYDRNGAAIQTALAASNPTTGDAKLYVQGMGGPNFGVTISKTTIEQLKELYKNEKIGIISAKLRFYSDEETWNNSYEKPKSFTVMKKNLYDFLSDITAYSYNGVYKLVKAYDTSKNPAYYDIGITKTLKTQVEDEDTPQDISLVMKLGDYLTNSSTGAYYGQNVDSRIYSPQRIVLVGTDPGNVKRAQLLVTYVKK